MRRLWFFRILLPFALVLFVVLIAFSLRDRPAIHRQPPASEHSATRRAEGVESVHIEGDKPTLDIRAKAVEQLANGAIRLEHIERLGIAREDGSPLVVSADSADISGQQGQRHMSIRDQVVVVDSDAGLRLELPALEVDETAGQARSRGAIRFEGPHARGSAEGLVYGLQGQPSELERPVFEDDTGLAVRADGALLHDGLRDVELHGNVEGHRPQQAFASGRMRVLRDDDGQLLRSTGTAGVSMHIESAAAAPMDLAADAIETVFDPPGQVARLDLTGGATLAQGADVLSAERIEVQSVAEAGAAWRVAAGESVRLRGRFGPEDGTLEARELTAEFDDRFELLRADARGDVRFDGATAHAEADDATFAPDGGAMGIRLAGAGRRKARLGRDRTRVAAERITTDARGTRLEAEGRVESTLLPGSTGGASGLFRTDEAIHFVSARLDGEDSGRRLTFSGQVRGWQGDRNLAADTVEVDQTRRVLDARGSVTTRMPRDRAAAAAAEADYVQIAAAALAYEEGARRAEYVGNVHALVSEGWLESGRLVVLLDDAGAIERIEALDDVRMEFRDDAAASGRVAGNADRLLWEPAASTIRLFGDTKPATVRRVGAGGASTSGRVLRYRLDVATLEVEAGEQGPARIQGGSAPATETVDPPTGRSEK